MLDKLFLAERVYAGNAFMPPAVTEVAKQYDNLYSFLLWASFISCVILIGGMVYFVTKYRRRSNNDKTPYITHSTVLEILWSSIPLLIFIVVFIWGWFIYHQMRSGKPGELEVHVIGKQWSWEFAYKSGKTSGNEMVVPVNTPVKLIMTSTDVIHSFFVPSMRIKQDVLPGQYTTLHFEAEKLGEYPVFCTEFCGTAHSSMLAKLKVVSREDYDKWIQVNEQGLSLFDKGQKYYNDKGCVACHSVDGTPKVGPSWKGLWGQKARDLADGTTAVVDENFLRKAMFEPNAQVAKGFQGIMPTYQGQLSEDQVNALIEFIKGLK